MGGAGRLECARARNQTVCEAQVDRAVELLWAVNRNQQLARYKIALLRAAADWIRRAQAALLILALLVAAYGIFGPEADVGGTEPRPPVATGSQAV